MRDNAPRSQLTRRTFMQASALAGGGLLLQIALGVPRRAAPGRAGSAVSLNAYVRIDTHGAVTMIMPKAEMGQGTWTSIPMLLAEELEVDPGAIQIEFAAPDPAFVFELNGDQSTGGSTSIRDTWAPVRKAGAAARLMLVGAAAHQWRVPAESCRAEGGAVLHPPSGRRLAYGALASAAAHLPVPKDPPLKGPAEYRLIGRSLPRRDSAAKSDGSAVFGIDVRLPGLRIGMLALAPAQGSVVVEPLATEAAMAIPGVRQVVNEKDAVAVIADDTWSARKGLQALGLRWSTGPNSAVQQSQLVKALEQAATREGAIAAQTGKLRDALGRAATRLEAVYHQPFLAHATMEPMNTTVHWHDGLCEVWTGTQAPDRAYAKLAELGLKPEQIRLHNHLIGGGFGRRLEVDGIVIAARIARHVDAPVKVLWSREEDVRQDKYRPYYVDHITAGLDAQGHPIAWGHTIAGSAVSAIYTGQALKNNVDEDAVTAAADPAYAFPNMEVRFVREEPQGVPTSWWRGVGPTRSIFVVESFIDEVAAAARQDPVAYRRALIKEPRLKAVLDLAVAKSGWGTALPQGQGRGISIQAAFGSYLAVVVEAVVSGHDVRVPRVVCALDCGQAVNPDGILSQVEGGVMFGLSAALHSEITIENGAVQQSNFHDYRVMRIPEAPRVELHRIENHESPGGIGETGTACVGAALCNAIYAATGKRIRTLPVRRGLQA